MVTAVERHAVPATPKRSPIQADDVLKAAGKIEEFIEVDRAIPAWKLIDFMSAKHDMPIPQVRAGLLYLLDRGIAESSGNSEIRLKPTLDGDGLSV